MLTRLALKKPKSVNNYEKGMFKLQSFVFDSLKFLINASAVTSSVFVLLLYKIRKEEGAY